MISSSLILVLKRRISIQANTSNNTAKMPCYLVLCFKLFIHYRWARNFCLAHNYCIKNCINSDSDSDSSEELNSFAHFQIRRSRVYQVWTDFFAKYDDVQFRQRFRLTKDSTLHLVGLLNHLLEPQSKAKTCTSVPEQILIALHFYATVFSNCQQ